MVKEEKEINICPRCGSTDISFMSSASGRMPTQYCKDCEYGRLEAIIEFTKIKKSKIEDFRKHLKNNK